MKFTYAYKTSDGTRHEETVDAPSRVAVFETLRAKGIRAIKVVAADGTRANGEVRGVRKRVVAAGAFFLVLCSLFGMLLAYRGGTHSASLVPSDAARQVPSADSLRHYVYGDPEIIQEIEAGGHGVVASSLDRYLLAFAIPGKAIPASLRCPDAPDPGRDLAAAAIAPADVREAVEYKQILNGMKRELKEYLDGGGTWTGYVRELALRQSEERRIFERTCRELEGCTNSAFRVERNAALRAIGLPTVPQKPIR